MLTQSTIDRLSALGDFYAAAAAFASVPGWLHEVEGFVLMTLAAFEPGAGAVVEIGSFKGRSTCWLAAGLKQRGSGKVHAVDHFTGSPEHQPGGTHPDPDIAAHGSTLPAFRANIARMGLGDFVEAIPKPSLAAAASWSGGPIRLLFIDGDHSYDASRADFQAWRPHLTPGALVGFHDVDTWPGVTQFYQELVASNPAFIQEAAINSLRVVRMPG